MRASEDKKCQFFGKFCVRTKWMIPYSWYRPEKTKEIEDAVIDTVFVSCFMLHLTKINV